MSSSSLSLPCLPNRSPSDASYVLRRSCTSQHRPHRSVSVATPVLGGRLCHPLSPICPVSLGFDLPIPTERTFPIPGSNLSGRSEPSEREMETGDGMGSKGVPTGFDDPSCILGAIPQGLKRDMAAPMRVRTPAMRTACWGGGHRRRVGLCRRRNRHREARAEPSSSGSDAEGTPAPRNEETEDSLGERAEKTVLVQYKVRTAWMGEDQGSWEERTSMDR